MGCLRFALAFAVFNAHAGLPIGFSLLAGSTAVHCFFVISGYYMAMVLTEKYGPQGAGYFDFMTSRLLRLMPSYWVVLMATLLVAWLTRQAASDALIPVFANAAAMSDGVPVGVVLAHVLSQVTLLGQDVYSFFVSTPQGDFAFSPIGDSSLISLREFLVVPPAWSLSAEIYFYMLAPLLARQSVRTLLALMTCSLLCRLLLALVLDWRLDPWSYRFFPSELLFFLTGIVAYRVSAHCARQPGWWMGSMFALGIVLGLVEIVGIWNEDMGARKWARVPLFALLCAIMPVLFERTRHWRWDRYMGELAYPLYISHFLVIWTMAGYTSTQHHVLARALLICAVLVSAVALHRWVDLPVERYRQFRLSRGSESALSKNPAVA